MIEYTIERLYDNHDCEICGSSYAEGYVIYNGGDEILRREPIASCYDSSSYDNPLLDILLIENIQVKWVTEYEDAEYD